MSPGPPTNSFDTSSNGDGGAPTPYSYNSHPQHSGPPPQYDGHFRHCDPPQQRNSHHHRLPQQHTGQSLHFNGPSQHYGPSQQRNGQRPQYNGPPQHYGPPQRYGSPPYFNSYEDNAHIQYSHIHPQRLKQLSYHAPSYLMAKQPQGGRRPPQKQAPVRFASNMGYVDDQSQDHHNGRGKSIYSSSFFFLFSF